MKKPYAIVLDSDEILLDWPSAFVGWHNKTYNTDITKISYYDELHNLFKVIHRDVIQERMNEFNSGRHADFAVINSCEYAQDFIQALSFYDIKIFVITKSGKKSATMRQKNLIDIFGNVFEHIFCIDIHESKVPYMQSIQENYDVLFFVDDYFKNCEQITNECNVTSIAVRTEHNKHLTPKGFIVDDTLSDIQSRIVNALDAL